MSPNELHESKLHEISHFTINKNTMLVIDCNNCKDKKRIFNASQKCMACFTKGFFTLKNRKIKGCLFRSRQTGCRINEKRRDCGYTKGHSGLFRKT